MSLPSLRERAVHRASDWGYAAGWGAVKYAPRAISQRAFRGAADLAAHRDGRGTQQLRRNYRRILASRSLDSAIDADELEALVADGLRSYSRYWLETFRLPRMNQAAIAEYMKARTEGVRYLDEALQKGRGAILALPHQGNWEIAGIWLVSHSGPFATVAERLKPESLFDRFLAYRESLGFEVLPLTGGQQPPTAVLTERLKQNKVVCLVADRDLSQNGIEVDFFGETAKMPAGPALLSATTGAPVLPVSCWYPGEGDWGQRINPPVPVPQGRLREQVKAMTQDMARCFEKDIAAHPADWHMLQRFWLADWEPRA